MCNPMDDSASQEAPVRSPVKPGEKSLLLTPEEHTLVIADIRKRFDSYLAPELMADPSFFDVAE